MTKPREVHTQKAAVEIGKKLVEYANLSDADKTAQEGATKAFILARIRRDGNAMPAGYSVEFAPEDPSQQKVLVVPDPQMMNTAKADMESDIANGLSGYGLFEIYEIAIARLFRDAAGDGDEALGRHVREIAEKPFSPHDFFHFRIGEYAINECK